jgi:hypothetical protein
MAKRRLKGREETMAEQVDDKVQDRTSTVASTSPPRRAVDPC